MREAANWSALASLIALIFLCSLWEGWLAPIRPGGSLLVLKALPLLAALPGTLRGKVYTAQWAALLVLAYFTEGVVRVWSERGWAQYLAGVEIVLAVMLFVSCLIYTRLSRSARDTHGS